MFPPLTFTYVYSRIEADFTKNRTQVACMQEGIDYMQAVSSVNKDKY